MIARPVVRERYRPVTDRVRRQLEKELTLIGKLGLEGYFLIVWDILRFFRENGILVQGRGSAANSGRLLFAAHHRGRSDRNGAIVRKISERRAG